MATVYIQAAILRAALRPDLRHVGETALELLRDVFTGGRQHSPHRPIMAQQVDDDSNT
jgi:hypothetical protein